MQRFHLVDRSRQLRTSRKNCSSFIPATRTADPRSELGDIFELASKRAGNSTRDILRGLLSVDAARTPVRFQTWFSLPWYRHYTLNIDDLDEAMASHYNLPRPLHSISADNDPLSNQPGLLSVHLNGCLRDYPNVTFSIRQYGQRASQPDAWYQTLVTDLLNHPILFIGTELEEIGLWQYIELRKQRHATEVEMRPASYLASPSLPAARAGLLKGFNINWIRATEEEIFTEVLADASPEAQMGHGELRRRYRPITPSSALLPLAQLRVRPAPDDLSFFLMGRTPTWADIQTGGFAVERWFERGLLADIRETRYDIILLTGTAASGKSTTAMRLALALEAAGKKTYVLEATQESWNVGSVLNAIRGVQPEVLLIDDADAFGTATSRLLRGVSGLPGHPLVIAAIRSSRLQNLDLMDEIADMSVLMKTVPSLHDQDIDALIDALTRANRLGRRAGQTAKQRREVFGEQAGRQLLVAMYYATSGERLKDRVHSECENLSGNSRLAYGMTALATSETQWISRDELIFGTSAVGGAPSNKDLNEIQKLIDLNLILAKGQELRLRHRWIAETAIEFYIKNGLVVNVIKAFAFVLAAKVDTQMSWFSRERKLLRRLINHDFLIRTVLEADSIREIYSFLEDRLSWDYHFWLQRGSLEVEVGELDPAENFLNSARSLAARSLAGKRDYLVDTEYAYLMLKKSARHPRATGASERAEKALRELEDVMRQHGSKEAYSFHVYGSQGLSWARRAPTTRDARLKLLERLRTAVDKGLELHAKNSDLQRLRDDLLREYMTMAVA